MSVIDSRLEFSDAQKLTAAADSENVVDLGTDRDIGPGRPMWVVVNVTSALDNDATVKLETSADNSTYTTIATATADKAEGSTLVIGVPYANERYLKLNYSGITSGTVEASLTDQEPRSFQAYPSAS